MKVDYWITDIIEKKKASYVVAGRITEGVLRIGAVFTSACTPVFVDEQRTEMKRQNPQSIALKIVDMEFRGKKFTELTAGDTPGLELSGSGLESLNSDTMLSFEV